MPPKQARTIAQLAASGIIRSAQGLNRQEQGELLIWARAQGMTYREIIQRFGFTQTEEGLRTWHYVLINDRPPRVPTFTALDDQLLRAAVQLFATGPLDQEKSINGIWKAVKEYIQRNGGTTSAGVTTLKKRWLAIRNQPAGASAAAGSSAAPSASRTRGGAARTGSIHATGSLARSFPVPTNPAPTTPTRGDKGKAAAGGSNKSSGAKAGFDGISGSSSNPALKWGEYSPLSKEEQREVLGGETLTSDEDEEEEDDDNASDSHSDSGDNPAMKWGHYSPLSKEERAEVLGEDNSTSSDEEEEEEEEQQQQEEEESDEESDESD
ncbi:hypothetical protein N8I77_007652 [Diaporthe amygdali]|uniref:Uncharacterized protein n=1 Tax=Phomopsis amygdali TaxID=1214568 RepID=A0AAD9SET6_PHOAM|nr:hypothetical protein N8I77_007652 [Diaporthe amygdali]